jgi:biotin synthase
MNPKPVLMDGVNGPDLSAFQPRYDWQRTEAEEIYGLPFSDLIFRAQIIHRENFDPNHVETASLLSIKTGGCPEDCGYCSQSAHYETDIKATRLMEQTAVVETAKRAKQAGASRFCMAAAWRNPKERDLDRVCDMVSEVKALGMETCATLGMLTTDQAKRLRDAGLDFYNHNVDTSPEFYGQIITTRNYDDRLRTLESVRKAGVTVCCGGIIGLGESEGDRIGLLQQLSTLNPHPESVPINALVRVAGTPLETVEGLDPLVFVRTIATARILMPASMVRLSAGRKALSREAVALCFVAGANSLFIGEKLLTTPNPEPDDDAAMLHSLGLEPLPLPLR